jgi:hypothetical protein
MIRKKNEIASVNQRLKLPKPIGKAPFVHNDRARACHVRKFDISCIDMK